MIATFRAVNEFIRAGWRRFMTSCLERADRGDAEHVSRSRIAAWRGESA